MKRPRILASSLHTFSPGQPASSDRRTSAAGWPTGRHQANAAGANANANANTNSFQSNFRINGKINLRVFFSFSFSV